MDYTSFGQKLADAGYWVFPLSQYRKATFPQDTRGRSWGRLMDDPTEGRVIAQTSLATGPELTGAVACFQPTDPVPVLVLDCDNYGADVGTVWASVGVDGPPPPTVRTASGGCHFWFRVPEGRSVDELPFEFNLGAGARGEVRGSREARQLLVLPGSVAINKQKARGSYTAIAMPQDMRELPEVPAQLWDRLKAGNNKAHDTSTKLPTEITHVLGLLGDRPAGSLLRGSYNTTISQVGQVLGRISGWERPSDEMADKAHQVLSGWLEEGESFDPTEFHQALNSGFRRGKKNGDKYQPRDKFPTVTDVLAECRNLFDGEPWLVEMMGPDGKTQDWLLGIGGSAKDRDEATRTVSLKAVEDAFVSLCQMGSVDLDTASQSPLHIMPGWRKALHLHLMATKAVDHQGLPPEVRFWTKLAELARDAARERAFLQTRNGSRSSYANLYIPAEDAPELVLLPEAQMYLNMYVRDNRVMSRERRRSASTRRLRGQSKGTESWSFPLRSVAEEAGDHDLTEWVLEQYAKYRAGSEDGAGSNDEE